MAKFGIPRAGKSFESFLPTRSKEISANYRTIGVMMTSARASDEAVVEWSIDGLKGAGFTGFVPFHALLETSVPAGAGVYIVLRLANAAPTFRGSSGAGHFKGREPSVSVDTLESKWVPGAAVLYIGKAETNARQARGLAKRLGEYRRHGSGEPIGHWGGRFIWQLDDWNDLIVAWRESPNGSAEEVESALIGSFIEKYRVLPFANLKRGRQPSATSL